MRVRLFRLVGILALLAVSAPASAQYGHPLKGTWTGDWGPSKQHIVLELNWDGKQLTGAINPGPNGVPLKVATLNPDTWTVHFEADGKDRSGNAAHYVIDGKLENIGAAQRVMTGTWSEGSTKGDFKLTRN